MTTSVKHIPLAMRRFTQRFELPHYKIQRADIDLTSETLKSLSQKVKDKYEIEEIIAQGGMKTIIRLRDKDTSRNVAMAMLTNADADLVSQGRFVREARITANLEHPNIIPIHEIGVDVNTPYFIMKLIEGETLLDIIEKMRANDPKYIERYTLTRLLRIYRQVVNAMIFAHARGVIHLDLSPGNILVGKFSEVLVLDWGLAQVVEQIDDEQLSNTLSLDIRERLSNTPNVAIEEGIAQGTPGYMSPEQASGVRASVDYRSDIYALGAILYTILTLRNAIKGVSIHEMLNATIEGRFIEPRKRIKKHVPNSLNALVMKAMKTDPLKRYQSITEIKDELDAYLEGRATQAENASFIRHALLFCKRHVYAVTFATLLLFTLFGYASYTLMSDYMGLFHWGTPTYKINLSSQLHSASAQLTFTNEKNDLVKEPFVFDAKGYIIPPKCFIWLPQRLPYFDSRCHFTVYASQFDFDIMYGAVNEPLTDSEHTPQGMIISFRENKIQLSYLGKSGAMTPFAQRKINFTDKKQQEYTVSIQSINGTMRIYINNILYLQFDNPFPPTQKKPSVAIRAGNVPITLHSVIIREVKVDDNLGIFVIPEMLTTRNKLEAAVDYYIHIANHTENQARAEHALLRVLAITSFRSRDTEEAQAFLKKLYKMIETDRFVALRGFYHMTQGDLLWKESKYTETLQVLNLLPTSQMKSYMATQLLNYNFPAPESIKERLRQYINYSTKSLKEGLPHE